MNGQNPIFTAVVIIAGVIGGLFVTLSVLLSSGNSLAHLCFYLLIGGGVLGLIAPRVAFFVWIFACAYSDLLKRFTIVFGDVSKRDLHYILGITPVMFSAIVVALAFGGVAGAYAVRQMHWILFLVGLAITALTGLIAGLAGGNSVEAVMQGVANGGLYSLLLFVVPVLFPYPHQMIKIFRFALWVFLPVALYGVVQALQGFLPFEIAYLRTGLSIEIKQLLTNRVRAFSTLNSPTALANLCAAMAVMCWYLARIPRRVGMAAQGRLSWIVALFMIVAYLSGLVASTGRAGLTVLIFAPISAWCFLSPMRTRLFYTVMVSIFLVLVTVSPWLLDHLEDANLWLFTKVDSGSLAGQLSTVGTYSDRLSGFAHVLRNPAAYSLFGFWSGSYDTLQAGLHHHDILSATLLRFGALGLGAILAVLTWTLHVLHRKLQSTTDPEVKQLMALCVGLGLSFLITSCLAGNILLVFPLNGFFWLWVSTAVLCTLPAPKPLPQRAAGSTGLDMTSMAGRTPGASRFSPRRA